MSFRLLALIAAFALSALVSSPGFAASASDISQLEALESAAKERLDAAKLSA